MSIRYLSGINVDNNVLFVDDANNRVGIGTGSPATALDVNGTISIGGSPIASFSGIYNRILRPNGDVGIYLGNATDAGNYYDNTTHYFRSSGGSSTYAVINYLGNVGIGTTSPSTKLHVNSAGGSGVTTQIKVTQADDGAGHPGADAILESSGWGEAYLKLGGHKLGAYGGILNIDSSSHIAFNLGGERVRITSAGNVGIGTTSPAQKLHVVGNTTITGVTYTDIVQTYNGASIDFRHQDASVVMRVDTANARVGIGTTSPSTNLHVAGSVRVTGDRIDVNSNTRITGAYYENSNTEYTYIDMYNGGNASINIGTKHPLSYISFESGSGAYTERMRITNTGNVGIGTTSPSDILHVHKSGANTRMIVGNNAAYDQFIYFQGNNDWSIGIDNSNSNAFTLSNYSSIGTNDRLTVTTGGNVGIGTTNPTEKLDVAGSGKIQGNLFLTAADPYIESSGSGALRIKHTAGQVMYIRPDQTGNVVFFEGASGQAVYLNTASPSVNSTQNSSSALTFEARARNAGGTLNIKSTSLQNTVYDIASNLSRFSITGQDVLYLEGNVGIGTNSPASISGYVAETINGVNGSFTEYRQNGTALFRVGADSSRPFLYGMTNAPIDFYTNTAQRMRIASDGNVGIGTTSPGEKLVVSNGGAAGFEWVPLTGRWYRYNRSTSAYGGIYTEASEHTWSIGTSEKMRLSSAGNVGIGTTSPAQKLDVAGGDIILSSNATYIRSKDASGNTPRMFGINPSNDTYIGPIDPYAGGAVFYGVSANVSSQTFYTGASARLHINSAGNVGIGTTAPGYKLDVNGTARISYHSILGYSTSIGENAFAWGFPGSYFGQMQNISGTVYGLGFGSGYTTVGTTVLSYNTSGNVGIGTTSPGAKLDVVGEIFASSNVQISSVGGAGKYYIRRPSDGSASAFFGYNSADNTDFGVYNGSGGGNVKFWSNNGIFQFNNIASSELMRITAAGNVGIGTTSPGKTLDVVGNARVSTAYANVGLSTITYAQLQGLPFILSDTTLDNVVGQVVTGIGLGYSNEITAAIVATDRGGSAAQSLDFITGTSTTIAARMSIDSAGNVGIGTIDPSQKLHVSGNVRVTGAYYDSNNSAGSSGQVLSSTGSGTAWVNQGEATATSLFDLLPAARTTYAWSVQLTAGTWADIFSSNTVLSNGTWMVQVYVDDFAVGGQQYQETYSGVMSWGSASSTNETGPEAISEIVLHRSGHAANAGNFYLRTVERPSSTLLLQGMSNQTYSAASTINFKFVKIF